MFNGFHYYIVARDHCYYRHTYENNKANCMKMASPHNATNYVLMIAEMRRYPQMSYKSDIVVLSGMYSLILNIYKKEY